MQEDSQAKGDKSQSHFGLHTSLLVAVFLYLVSLIKQLSAQLNHQFSGNNPNNLPVVFFMTFLYAMSAPLITS